MSKTYDEIKTAVMDNQFTTKTLPVKDIKYLKDDLILIKNTPIKSGKTMTKKLLSALGVRTEMIHNLDKIAPEMTEHYIKRARASKKLNNINVVFDKHNKIVSFSNTETQIMPGEVFMDIVSRLLNDSSNLDVSDISVSPTGVTLNMLDHNSEIDLFANGGDTGKEVFKFGTSLSTGLEAPLSFDQFASRLWCTNGCTTQIDKKTFDVGEVTPESIWNFMAKFDTFQKNGYGRTFFEGHMQTCTNTRASVKETLDVYSLIEGQLGDALAVELLPVGHLYRDYAKSGVDLVKMTLKQRATAVTNYSVWQVFNALTDAASNFGQHNMAMQMKAGQLLTGTKDMENVIAVNPYGNIRI